MSYIKLLENETVKKILNQLNSEGFDYKNISFLKEYLRLFGLNHIIYGLMNLPELKDYQKEAVEAFLKSGENGRIKGTIVMPTGTGKTIVAMAIMSKICPEAGRAIVIVPYIQLLTQWKRFLEKAGLTVGSYYGRERILNEAKQLNEKEDIILAKDAVVAVINSVSNNPEILKNFEFIVVDEVHHIASKKFKNILKEIANKRYALGLTSVIQRLDGMHHYITYFLPIVYELTLRKAIEKGWVSRLIIKEVPVNMNMQELITYEELTEKIKRFYKYFGYNADIYKIEHPLAEAAKAAITKRKILLANIYEKKKAVYSILKQNINEKILLFNTSIESTEMIKNIISADQELKSRFAIYHSKMNIKEREEMLEKFRTGEKNIMLSVKALEEGLDVPDASIGIVVASDRTKRAFIQKMGRIMRKTEKKWKEIYVVYTRGTIEEEIKRRMEWLTMR